ncbi:MAG: hypothetical protein HYX49_06945 [Chloroflexi bacterium]|nr:hypothetical protein [Chloroflexota bacterium]
MSDDKHTKSEIHGCIMCGKLYQLYVVEDANGKFIDCKVMSGDGKCIPNQGRPLVVCKKHTDREIETAIARTYGNLQEDED